MQYDRTVIRSCFFPLENYLDGTQWINAEIALLSTHCFLYTIDRIQLKIMVKNGINLEMI